VRRGASKKAGKPQSAAYCLVSAPLTQRFAGPDQARRRERSVLSPAPTVVLVAHDTFVTWHLVSGVQGVGRCLSPVSMTFAQGSDVVRPVRPDAIATRWRSATRPTAPRARRLGRTEGELGSLDFDAAHVEPIILSRFGGEWKRQPLSGRLRALGRNLLVGRSGAGSAMGAGGRVRGAVQTCCRWPCRRGRGRRDPARRATRGGLPDRRG
jgi:hypothetical protein